MRSLGFLTVGIPRFSVSCRRLVAYAHRGEIARRPGARQRCGAHGQHRQVIGKGVALFRLGEPNDAQILVAGDEKRCDFLVPGAELN